MFCEKFAKRVSMLSLAENEHAISEIGHGEALWAHISLGQGKVPLYTDNSVSRHSKW